MLLPSVMSNVSFSSAKSGSVVAFFTVLVRFQGLWEEVPIRHVM